MVQRYEFCQWSNDEAGMQAEPDGAWVKYEDYEALETKLLAAHSHIERALASSHNKKDGYIKMALRELE